MIKRTLEISQAPAHLRVKNEQLLIEQPGRPEPVSVPCEDVGLVVVDHPGTTYSHYALATLSRFGAGVVICGANHLPAAMVLPIPQHSEGVHRLHEQIAVPKPRRKQLWKQLVVAKVRAQAANLPPGSDGRRRLGELARRVRSGDPTNVEAQAAKVYWQGWLGEDAVFRRDKDGGDGLNAMLNYGYAVVRASVARALVGAGLHPALGIHHANRANAFCLADDLLEPLRPLVDARARRLHLDGCAELDPQAKAGLLEVLTATTLVDGEKSPLMVGLHRYVASLVRCFRGEAATLLIPTAAEPGHA